jgi:hypothetical protein
MQHLLRHRTHLQSTDARASVVPIINRIGIDGLRGTEDRPRLAGESFRIRAANMQLRN